MVKKNIKSSGSAKNLVIVESPAKADTLKKFLGSSYKIEASLGHVRDLPKSQMGINIENDFEPKYITIRGKGELLSKLRKEAKNAKKVYLATDPDREGEAISWHLMHALDLDEKKTSRITFNEITKNAVLKSLTEARSIDMNLVDAQQARRELDRIVGYKLSPLLWKKVQKGLSAGRVQSAALKLICDRESEIENFVREEYWTLEALVKEGTEFTVKLNAVENGKYLYRTKEDIERVLSEIGENEFIVKECKKSKRVKNPIPPFTTSTLQQEASKVLGFAANKTMMIAQQLYEGVKIEGEGTVGLVSYIRTDSVRISDEAYSDAKNYIQQQFGSEYSSKEKPEYKSRGRTQDAHEAIRPTESKRTADSIKGSLSRDQYRLYKLIWERFIASQMTPAVYDTVSLRAAAGDKLFRASGSTQTFDGYLKVYKKNEEADDEIKIPFLNEGSKLTLVEYLPEQHFTQAPPRYTEANLVKTMEELGIGRPSTYAAIISILVQKRYVTKENKVFYSTVLGETVTDIMMKNFDDIVDIEFTAKMENDLDKVEEGHMEWKEVVRNFYEPFDQKIQVAESNIDHVNIELETTDVICDNCGRNMVVKYGRFGKFLACPGFPECKNTKPFYEEANVECPLCHKKILLKKTKKGRRFYGCEDLSCGFMSWSKPTGELCPDCGSFLIEKGTKNKQIVCSNSECGYRKKSEEDADDTE